jgi:SAM-dependent methyltransferase
MASPETLELLDAITAYQRSALIGTAVETGVADALADGERQVARIAESCGTDERGTHALLAGLVAIGIAERDGDGFAPTAAGRLLVSGHPGGLASIARKEWFFYRVWATLPEAVRDGHSRIPPWRRRLEEDPETALEFLRALDDLAALFGSELPSLAGPCRGRLLDAGGGAGSHAAVLVAANPGLEATVLDLPPVEAVLRERHPELGFVVGDLDSPRFGRPEGEVWDVVLLANILHDHPADRCAAYVREAAGLLAPEGSLLVYEWVVDEDRVSPHSVALFTPMMLVENEGGWTWTEAEIAAWMRDAGLHPGVLRRGEGPIAVLRGNLPVGGRSHPGEQ